MARTKATTPPPVSKTVQRLLAQIHAEAEATTLEALSAKDGIVAVQPMPAQRRKVHETTARGFGVTGADGSELRFYIDHDARESRLIGPRWCASQTLLDGHGRKWQTWHGFEFITDDFGNMVDVEGGAACSS
ncbi:MAG: hypothetical protein ACK40L_08560 [Hydrogenophaga sp.]